MSMNFRLAILYYFSIIQFVCANCMYLYYLYQLRASVQILPVYCILYPHVYLKVINLFKTIIQFGKTVTIFSILSSVL